MFWKIAIPVPFCYKYIDDEQFLSNQKMIAPSTMSGFFPNELVVHQLMFPGMCLYTRVATLALHFASINVHVWQINRLTEK